MIAIAYTIAIYTDVSGVVGAEGIEPPTSAM